jgi:hypothetical protein
MRARGWLATWVFALLIALGGAAGLETYLRRLDYVPTVQDDPDLWALAYERVRLKPDALVLLGASRIQFALDPEMIEQATGRPTAMLAVNGHYPLATLRFLAEDEAFRGLVVVGIDSRGLNAKHWDMQQPWVEHWNNRWSLARRINRLLITPLQEQWVIARSPFALANLLRRQAAGWGLPFNDYVILRPERVGYVDYRRTDITAIRRQRILDLEQYYRDHPPPPPEAWLKVAEPLAQWVAAIKQRGGKVVFFREPVSGEHLDLDERNYPRAKYWDVLAARQILPMIDFRDQPALAHFALPDTSHIDGIDVPAFTQAFIALMREQGHWPGVARQ